MGSQSKICWNYCFKTLTAQFELFQFCPRYFRRRSREMGLLVLGHDMSPIIPLMIFSPSKGWWVEVFIVRFYNIFSLCNAVSSFTRFLSYSVANDAAWYSLSAFPLLFQCSFTWTGKAENSSCWRHISRHSNFDSEPLKDMSISCTHHWNARQGEKALLWQIRTCTDLATTGIVDTLCITTLYLSQSLPYFIPLGFALLQSWFRFCFSVYVS